MTTYPAQHDPNAPRTRVTTPVDTPWLARVLILALLGAALLVIALAALWVGFQAVYAERIMPGVSAFGVPLGGMTQDEAARVLADKFTFDDNAVFTFRHQNQFWQFTAGQLGVRYDPAQTVARAFAHGRAADAASTAAEQLLTWLNGRAVEPVITFDQNVAAAKLNEIAATLNRPSSEGYLRIDGTQVTAQSGTTGLTLDVAAALAQVSRAISALNSGAEIPLTLKETPPTIVGIELAEARARAALSAPLQLIADDGQGGLLGPWVISPEQIAALLEVHLVDNGDGTRSYDVRLDFDAFRAQLEAMQPALVTAPQDARFHFNDRTGQLEVIKPSRGGRTLNVNKTLEQLEARAFSTTDRTVSMVFDYTQPRYHEGLTAQQLGITQLVAEATTFFRGSQQNRRTNIAIAAARLDGVIVGPGEEFSFNKLIGEISSQNGFLEDKLIFGGRTINGVGGGVCQVSTTVFRAALYGGYTIIERNSHGYRVGYYEQNHQPPGLDAAIWSPERDFRFQNDTPYHLLLEVSIYPTDDSIQFRFYSTPTGRTVHVEQPRIANVTPPKPTVYEVNRELQLGQEIWVDYPAEGADVNVTRTITYPDGTVKTDNFFTHYLSWGAIVQVAPGDPRLGQ